MQQTNQFRFMHLESNWKEHKVNSSPQLVWLLSFDINVIGRVQQHERAVYILVQPTILSKWLVAATEVSSMSSYYNYNPIIRL